MKTSTIVMTCLSLTISTTRGQVDTTRKEFFPLHVGDVWQYRTETNQVYIAKIRTDTVLNGVHYYVFESVGLRTSGSGITRTDSLMRVQNRRGLPTGGENCGGGTSYEVSTYRLAVPIDSAWQICDYFWGLPTQSPLARCKGTSPRNVFGQVRDVMRFEFGGTSPPPLDTLFGTGALLARGIGVIYEQYYDGGLRTLEGAIINGIRYGTVSVGEPLGRLPREILLSQNFPNPFNPSTTIGFEVSRETHVHLSVCDILGREIIVLVNKLEHPGNYEVTFSGENLASGIYYYRLFAENRIFTRKMILQK